MPVDTRPAVGLLVVVYYLPQDHQSPGITDSVTVGVGSSSVGTVGFIQLSFDSATAGVEDGSMGPSATLWSLVVHPINVTMHKIALHTTKTRCPNQIPSQEKSKCTMANTIVEDFKNRPHIVLSYILLALTHLEWYMYAGEPLTPTFRLHLQARPYICRIFSSFFRLILLMAS